MDEPQPAPAASDDAQASRAQLTRLDADFIRVLEDLIDALLANGTLRLTDLPAQALDKLAQRRKTRERLRDALDLIGDDEPLL
ncbi:hypothetical protein GCM10022279_08000 [Comamonas faecalis]|uniref:Tryptophan synthase subunit beta like protein n=1 Tax=Comamonas faecalis TaxID=1387849 RepID=A0ABP7QSE2_9BURK